MKLSIEQKIYQHLIKLIPNLKGMEVGSDLKSIVPGYMDLNVDILYQDEVEMRIALSHYYSENGDRIADPDMEISVYFENTTARAISYQDRYGYQRIHSDQDATLQKELNQFLLQWMRNCQDQGHQLKQR